MLNMLSRCGIQFQRRYGARFGCWPEEEIIPPGIALATGISVHRAVEANLRHKIDSEGGLLDRETVAEIARDEFNGLWQGGLLLTDEESENLKKTFGSALDQTIALAWLHHDNLAGQLNPVAVEERFVITLDGYPFDIAGTKDIRESNGTIRDTKTAARNPSADAAKTQQMAMYALAEKIRTRGDYPKRVTHDCLVKTKTPKLVVCEAVPDPSWIDPLIRRIEQATQIIQSAVRDKAPFTPADPDSWTCSARYCGYHATCKFWGGRN